MSASIRRTGSNTSRSTDSIDASPLSSENCEKYPMRRSAATSISPSDGSSRPRISLSTVVLPEPLRPSSPVRSPGARR